MTIISALINSDAYVVFKSRRLAFHREHWMVYERLPEDTETRVLLKTQNQEMAVEFLLGKQERKDDG